MGSDSPDAQVNFGEKDVIQQNTNKKITIDLTYETDNGSEEEERCKKRAKIGDDYENDQDQKSITNSPDVRQLLEYSVWVWAHNEKERNQDINSNSALLQNRIVEKYESRKDIGTVKNGALGSKQLYDFVIKELQRDECKNSTTVGKWLLMNISFDDIVDIWNKIKIATKYGELGCTSKVGKMTSGESVTYMICVYTQDFRDKQKLTEVLNKLADLNVLRDSFGKKKQTIPYKIDLITIAFSQRYGTSSINNGTFWEGRNENGRWIVKEPDHFKKNNGLGAKVHVNIR